MRVLFTTQPADGHINPMLGLSRALRREGHEVVIATSGTYIDRLAERGERAVTVGPDWVESAGPVDPPSADHGSTYFERLFLGSAAHGMATDLIDVIADLRPDVVVRESVEFAGAVAAERCGVPFATFHFAFPIDLQLMTSTGDIVDARPLDRLRATVGLDAASDPDWLLGDLVISTLPEAYLGDHEPRVPTITIRPNAMAAGDEGDAPSWVSELDGAVYVSFGTVFTAHFPHVLSTAATGASRSGRATVITYGASADPEALDLPDGDHVRVAEYVPQGPVLDGCSVAVTHGGTGTTLGALARGVPVVVIPLGADQHAHAASVERLGAGLRLGHEELTPTAVSEAVETILGDDRFRRAARSVAASLAGLPGPEHAIPRLDALRYRASPGT